MIGLLLLFVYFCIVVILLLTSFARVYRKEKKNSVAIFNNNNNDDNGKVKHEHETYKNEGIKKKMIYYVFTAVVEYEWKGVRLFNVLVSRIVRVIHGSLKKLFR